MALSELPLHLTFLTDAAHLLSSTSPETSAFLMSSRQKLMVENDIELGDTQKQHACTCCGHIMIPGQGTFVEIKTVRASRRKSSVQKPKTSHHQTRQYTKVGPSKVFTCGNCGRYTKFALPNPTPITRRKPTVSDAPVSLGRPAEAQKPSANASSKKRAKNRKAGLQALLDQSKSSGGQAGSGLGLSLSDFMKKK